MFLDRIRLSGELGLIDEKILDFQRQTVGRNQVARGQKNDIALHQLRQSQRARQTVAQRHDGHGDLLGQTLGRSAGTMLLEKIQQHTGQDDDADDGGAHDIARHRRNAAGRQQDQHQRVLEPRQ